MRAAVVSMQPAALGGAVQVLHPNPVTDMPSSSAVPLSVVLSDHSAQSLTAPPCQSGWGWTATMCEDFPRDSQRYLGEYR